MADTVKVTCTNNDRVVDAKITQRTMKRLVVMLAMGGGSIELVLSREETTKPFVGRMAGMEFTAPATT